ncbi:hypothetical protein [Allofournierella massiliensis]|uniref:Bypass of forespore C C-terminal domain-containing protein n=1 Tax=Allofournierella massiliensis TaxID=1650663 RepID=A0A4R1R1K2_9FIRM|nr:hypothetical protein [Fournierella massiliensis]TCL59204.1 hypothetical protein EDD77_106121 [Fournierella massiliensis]
MPKVWIYLLALLCALGLAASVAVFMLRPFEEEAPESSYTLRDWHGRLALFESGEAEQPVEVYDVYTHLLPENDVLSLQAGIPLENREQLQRLLEDFGL